MIRMTAGLAVEHAARNINELERQLQARIPDLTWCFVEPDVAD